MEEVNSIISGTRIRVIDIAIESDRLGLNLIRLLMPLHPHLKLEAVHDALSYYYENKDAINDLIRKKKNIIKKIAKKPLLF